MEVLDYGQNAIYDYTQGQNKKAHQFEQLNSKPLPQEATKYSAFNEPSNASNVGCTASYPLGSLQKDGNKIIDQGYLDYMNSTNNRQKNMVGPSFVNTNSVNAKGGTSGIMAMTNANIPLGPVKNTEGFSGMVSSMNGGVQESFSNYGINDANPASAQEVLDPIPTNDPTSEMLLDLKSRPMTDFVHNNMVPFYGSSVKQNMAGTGVATGNYVDGVNVQSGFDDETPYHEKLSTFTGLDDTYLHKREVGPMYSPAEQQEGWVYGMPAFRPDESRYKESIKFRPDMKPVESEMVGPGIDIGAEIPAQGGFHQYTRVLPNNVSDYKANQLEGRVIEQGWQLGGQEPTAYPGVGGTLNQRSPGVVKNRPNSFWTQARYPTMTTKASPEMQGDEVRADWSASFRPNANLREQTSYGYGEIVYRDTVPPTNGEISSAALNVKAYNLGTGAATEVTQAPW